MKESKPVNIVLYTVVSEAKDQIKRLTDEEVQYCIEKTASVTVKKMLEVEQRKRSKARS